jgi:[ribosomal protein S18]-alanine N-acetyltransferase
VAFNLRAFQSADFEALWQIDQKCFPRGIAYSRAELSVYLSAPGIFALVAETSSADAERSRLIKHEIVGFIVAQSNPRGIGHIITIDVLPEGRRSGVGSALLAAAEQHLRSAHCDRVRLEAAVDNEAALDFYKRYGYAITKTIPGYYATGADAFVLVKSL